MFWTTLHALWFIVWLALAAIAIAHLLTHKREPSSTLSWLFIVTTVPVLGSLLFFIFGPQRLERNAIKRKSKLLHTQPPVPESESLVPNTFFGLARSISDYSVTHCNHIEVLNDPHSALLSMQEAIQNAKHFIHLEYYIISSDEVTEQLFESLLQARHRGVEVRILYDSLGSLFLKRIYFRKLLEAKVEVAGFLPFNYLPQRFNFNFRNHRKILLVDGELAFTGGANIGKQYLGKTSDAQWRDHTFKVSGPVCAQLQDVFAKDWFFTTKNDLSEEKYLNSLKDCGDATIQVLESGPDSEFRNLHRALLMAISSAEKRVWITTPYFVPDSALIAVLEIAGVRGIDVRIIVPAKTDAPVVRWASRSFYRELMLSGIRIFEYQPRILHAKTMLVDDDCVVLGSANMDIRSFRLNFELNLLIQSKHLGKQIELTIQENLNDSLEIQLEEFEKRSFRNRLSENVASLLSPLL